jgi:two-component system NarL family response regulator
MRRRIVVADGHGMALESLAGMLARRYDVTAIATSVRELLAILPLINVDCLLLAFSGVTELLPVFQNLRPGLRVIIITSIDDRSVAGEALRRGANGIVPRTASIAELDAAIETVLAGERYLGSEPTGASEHEERPTKAKGLDQFTLRQEQVILLLGEGWPAVEIARVLHIAPSTVTFHKKRMMKRLGITSDRELRLYAILRRARMGPSNSADRQVDLGA